MKGITIRPERDGDETRIPSVISKAFAGQSFSNGQEAEIYRRLIRDRAIDASYVGVARFGRIVGSVVFSEVTVDGEYCAMSGLGPLAVLPRWQRQGIASALVEAGLAGLKRLGMAGCVVLGDPAFYGRFGFRHDPQLVLPGPPPEYFQRIVFSGADPRGVVRYDPAFG